MRSKFVILVYGGNGKGILKGVLAQDWYIMLQVKAC